MLKNIYESKRKTLLDEAQSLIDNGDFSGFESKKKEIEKLDNDFENQAEALASFNALNGNKPSRAAETYRNGVDIMNTSTDIFDTAEYHNSFMNYVLKGKAMPSEYLNADANTKTTDVSPVIPTTVLNRIVEKMENIGTVLPLVTRTSYKGALSIPTSDVKPVATWVSEGSGSDKQKNGVNGTVTFSYHKLRCAVSMTLEVETMALSAFESKFVNDVANAMTKALEQAIISGDGTGKPKGILAETPVTGQALSFKSGDKVSYSTLVDMEAALPTAYENGAVYFMTKKTFMQFVGMVDNSGQPIARVNYGIAGKADRVLLGRSVVLIDGYMDSYAASVTADTVIAFLFNPADYILNTNLNVTVKTYEDNDTEDKITKAVMIVDGKVVDKNSLVTLSIQAPSK